VRVLIVDDEALARLRLRSLINGLPEAGVQAVAEAADTEQALQALNHASRQRTPFDVLLLDIRLPGASPHMGLRLARELKALPHVPAVVFVSAHAEHALSAFELDAVDYLTKPVRRERLLLALQRVRQRMDAGLASTWGDTPAPAAVSTNAADSAGSASLVVSERGRVLRVPLVELLYLKAEQKHVVLCTVHSSHVLDESLAELGERLMQLTGAAGEPHRQAFIRIHRNALVARHAIRELALRDPQGFEDGSDGWAVRVAPGNEWLSVSRRQVAAVRAALALDAPT